MFLYIDFLLIIAGALLLIIGYPLGWTDSNFVLYSSLACIALGVILNVVLYKRRRIY